METLQIIGLIIGILFIGGIIISGIGGNDTCGF